MVPVIKRPETADQFDGSIPFLNDYTLEEQVEYWKENRLSVKYMHDRFPDAFRTFTRLYGQEVADEILTLI